MSGEEDVEVGLPASADKPEQPASSPAKSTTSTKSAGSTIKGSATTSFNTDPAKGLSNTDVEKAIEKYGKNEIPVHTTPAIVMFLSQFVGFLPFLIEIAAIISISLLDWPDFIVLVCMLIVNGCLGFREEWHAKKALDELANSVESNVTVIRNGGVAEEVPTTDIVPGDIILLVGGTIIPADCEWKRGDTMSIDTAAMTGEPLPRKYPGEHGSVMLSGTTVKSGECYALIVATGTDTEMGQAQADILSDKSVRIVSVFEKQIMNVVKMLVATATIIVIIDVLVYGLVYDQFDNHDDIFNVILDCLAILIAAIPIALPLVLQVNLALGAAHLAKVHNAIVTSVPALQDIASMSILCSDKTGTLTTANMSIITEKIHAGEGFTEADVLLYAFLTSNPDKKDDPIDRAVVNAFHAHPELGKKMADKYKQEHYIGFNPIVKRTVAFISEVDDDDHKVIMTIGKGLPAKILDTSAGGEDDHEIQWKTDVYANKVFLDNLKKYELELSHAGYKTIAVCVSQSDAREPGAHVWKFVGLLPMLDPPREDTSQTIASLHHANVSVKMITGDHVNVGRETARMIGLGTDIQAGEDIRNCNSEQEKRDLIWNADGFAAVLPSDKRECVLTLRNDFGCVTGMTGDGVNDAPALSAANVGIAVQGATDAAKNAADLILTEPGLSPIYGAVLESRRIFARLMSYVVYRIAASIIMVLVLSIIIYTDGCSVKSLLVILLALINDISMIPVAYDNAKATAKPQRGNVVKMSLTSLYFGLMQAGLAIMFIYINNNRQSLREPIDLAMCHKETRGFVWLHLVFATEIMIFSARAPNYCWQSLPSIWLVLSVTMACVVGFLIAVFSEGVPWWNVLWIFLFNLGALLVIDIGKVWFKSIINDSPGDVIEGDELMTLDEDETETAKHMKKQIRQSVHLESALSFRDQEHHIEIYDKPTGCWGRFAAQFRFLRMNHVTDGWITKKHHNIVPPPPPQNKRSSAKAL